MSSRRVASLVVASVVVMLLAGSLGWNEWRTRRLERIRIGGSKADVIAAFGEPDRDGPSGVFCGCWNVPAGECWTWKLVGQSYLCVCFDKAGKVICHDVVTIWT